MLHWPIAFAHDVTFIATINCSPDSYVASSVAGTVESAIERARDEIQAGAHVIEVGGLSGGSRASRVSPDEELARTIPALKAIREEFPQVTMCIDTFRPAVAEAAFEAGATWINDVTSLEDDRLVALTRDYGAVAVLAHLAGPSGAGGRKLNRPFFADVAAEVRAYFEERIATLSEAGIPAERVIIDVNLSGGKRPAHDYDLLAALQSFNDLGCKQMLGVSRKSFIEGVHPGPPEARLGGSIVAALWGVLQGVSYLRVHEVRPYAQALDVWNAIMTKALPQT